MLGWRAGGPVSCPWRWGGAGRGTASALSLRGTRRRPGLLPVSGLLLSQPHSCQLLPPCAISPQSSPHGQPHPGTSRLSLHALLSVCHVFMLFPPLGSLPASVHRSESGMSADTHTAIPPRASATPWDADAPAWHLPAGTAHQHPKLRTDPNMITHLFSTLRTATSHGSKHRTPKIQCDTGWGRQCDSIKTDVST